MIARLVLGPNGPRLVARGDRSGRRPAVVVVDRALYSEASAGEWPANAASRPLVARFRGGSYVAGDFLRVLASPPETRRRPLLVADAAVRELVRASRNRLARRYALGRARFRPADRPAGRARAFALLVLLALSIVGFAAVGRGVRAARAERAAVTEAARANDLAAARRDALLRERDELRTRIDALERWVGVAPTRMLGAVAAALEPGERLRSMVCRGDLVSVVTETARGPELAAALGRLAEIGSVTHTVTAGDGAPVASIEALRGRADAVGAEPSTGDPADDDALRSDVDALRVRLAELTRSPRVVRDATEIARAVRDAADRRAVTLSRLGTSGESGTVNANVAAAPLAAIEWLREVERLAEESRLLVTAFSLQSAAVPASRIARPGGTPDRVMIDLELAPASGATSPAPSATTRTRFTRAMAEWPVATVEETAALLAVSNGRVAETGRQSQGGPPSSAGRARGDGFPGAHGGAPVYLGAVTTGTTTSYALRLADPDVVCVLAPGESAYGWEVLRTEPGRVVVRKEESVHVLETM